MIATGCTLDVSESFCYFTDPTLIHDSFTYSSISCDESSYFSKLTDCLRLELIEFTNL